MTDRTIALLGRSMTEQVAVQVLPLPPVSQVMGDPLAVPLSVPPVATTVSTGRRVNLTPTVGVAPDTVRVHCTAAVVGGAGDAAEGVQLVQELKYEVASAVAVNWTLEPAGN